MATAQSMTGSIDTPLDYARPTLPKLLLVDDREENLFTLRRLLSVVPGEMHTATSGGEALSLMLQHDYALVLLDVQMPHMDGFETATLMREHEKTRDTPVIFVTAMSKEQRYINAGYAAGAVDYLLKPIEPAILLSKVRVFLDLETKRNKLQTAMSALKRVSRHQKLILSCANEGILGIDRQGNIIFSNPSAERLLRSNERKLCGLHLSEIFAETESGTRDFDAVMSIIAGDGQYRSEDARFDCLDGTSIPVDYSCAALIDEDQDCTGGVLVFNDITERKSIEQQLIRLARYDELTGLANRTLFREFLRKSMARAKRGGRLMALLFIDLDRFKAVNDELGHTMGDKLLCEVASRLTHAVRESDLVARLGGDEFAVVLDEIETPANAGRIVEKLLSDISRPCLLDGRTVSTCSSVGVAVYRGDEESPDALIKKADTAMYEAKRRGRNGYRYFADGMDDDVSRRSLLESDLATAVRSGGLEVHFQPQFHARDGHLVGFEVLARWFDKRRGFVTPGEFIPIAEQSGLIEELGAAVMSTACAQLRAWRDAGLVAEDCRMAVNVSVMQLHSGKLIGMVRDCLEQQQLAPHNIEIELTESTVMDDAPAAIEQLAELSDVGVRIAIDDFGTGYSSLSYLQRLPIKTLKIDRSFTNALETHAGSQVIVQSIIALARSLGLAVVAEGVETQAEADYLRAQGCDMLQGYHLAKPAAADCIEASLRSGIFDSDA